MKKNITMNLFGTLYAIDEDAYELLNNYLNNMKQYFLHREDGEEIYDDIEHRMAELLSELHAKEVKAFNIDHIKDLIKRIGSPEEMDGTSSDTRPPYTDNEDYDGPDENWLRGYYNRIKRKKLYRNPDDQIIGGVLSGIACFLDVNSIWVRLATILLILFSMGTVFIAYLLLWIIIPLAQTPEDRLLMKGIPVNMDNIRDEIMNENKMQNTVSTPRPLSIANTLLKVLAILVATTILLPFAIALFGLLIAIFCVVFGYIKGNNITEDISSVFPSLNYLYQGNTIPIIWIGAISGVICLGLTLYMGIHFMLRLFRHVSPLSIPQRTACIIGCILSFAVSVSSFVICESTWSNYKEEQRNQDYYEKQKKYLKENGWNIIKDKNCIHYTSKGEYYTGNRQRIYIDGYAENGLKYELEKTVKVAPGIYRLRAIARANGNGCYVFAYNPTKKYTVAVPSHSNEGGNIWSDAVARLEKDSLENNPILRNIAKAKDGKGYGWNEVIIEDIEMKDSVLHYGITNDCPEKDWTGTWFSVTDFSLEKVK